MPEVDPKTGEPEKTEAQKRFEALEAKVETLHLKEAEREKRRAEREKMKADKAKLPPKTQDDDGDDWARIVPG